MGRPSASIQNKILGICFAKTMCKATANKLDLVARSGPYSIFQAIKDIFPLCIREETFFRDGLNEVQLNKALQNAGFKRVRDRRAHAIKRTKDPTGAGMYLFSSVKWRNPDDFADRNEMISGWNTICQRFPLVAQRCDVEQFLSVVGKFQKTWQPNAARMSNRANFEDEEEDSVEALWPHSSSSWHAESAQRTPSAMEQLTSSQILAGQDLTDQQVFPQAFQDILRLQLELAKAQTLALLQQAQPPHTEGTCLRRLPPISLPSTIAHVIPILPPVTPPNLLVSSPALAPLPPPSLSSALDLPSSVGGKQGAAGRVSPLEALRECTSTTFHGMHDLEMKFSATALSHSELRLNLNALVCQQ